jgi:hypothetical protein
MAPRHGCVLSRAPVTAAPLFKGRHAKFQTPIWGRKFACAMPAIQLSPPQYDGRRHEVWRAWGTSAFAANLLRAIGANSSSIV